MLNTKSLIERIQALQSLCDNAESKKDYPLVAVVMTSLARELNQSAHYIQEEANRITEGHITNLLSLQKTLKRVGLVE